jgi:hypothetical protein
MSGACASSGDTAASQAALEELAAVLDPGDHVTTLVAEEGRIPYLTISSRHSSLTENIRADSELFWWSWAEPLGPMHDLAGAARKITNVLGTTARAPARLTRDHSLPRGRAATPAPRPRGTPTMAFVVGSANAHKRMWSLA